MSHRTYLYNVAGPGEARSDDRMMVECGYDLPLLLQPLLAVGGTTGGNNYNHHVEGNNTGLFFDAPPGIANLKAFYRFLSDHQSALIDRPKAFKSAQKKLFAYIDR